MKLGSQKQWLHLLHYHQAGFQGPSTSQVDTAEFFLAKNGKRNPVQELQATYYALLAETVRDDDSVFCRYPARVNWLARQLSEIAALRGDCAALQAWQQQIDASQLTLVFPAAYLNSPSSMYGHTLIRANKRQGGNPLLDYVVNFAANTPPGDNEIVFAWKGLTGGYPGVVSILPYYKKINDYNFLESRDIWEYRLALTQEEVDQFLRHIWELRGIQFDYFFFTENCSYQLLALLDAASERLDLTRQFRIRAIPSDTVRAVVQAGIVSSTHYRPSALTNMRNKYQQLATEERELAVNLAMPGDAAEITLARLDQLPEKNAARILETAYDFGRFRAIKGKRSSEQDSAHSIALLARRSALTAEQLFPDVEVPRTRDDQGHATRRFGAAIGHDGERDYEALSLRLAFHDALDPPDGYLANATLEMIGFELRYLHERSLRSGELQLQALRLIDIHSLSPVNRILKPLSWRVSTGARRLRETEPLAAYLQTGFGRSMLLGDWLVYGFADIALDVGKPLSGGYQLAAGPALGVQRQGREWSFNFEGAYLANDQGQDHSRGQAAVVLARHFGKPWQLRYRAQYFDQADYEELSHQFSWHRFF